MANAVAILVWASFGFDILAAGNPNSVSASRGCPEAMNAKHYKFAVVRDVFSLNGGIPVSAMAASALAKRWGDSGATFQPKLKNSNEISR